MTNYMVSRCSDCGKEIQSDDKQAIEIWWKRWGNELKAAKDIKIVCVDCFRDDPKYSGMAIS